HGPSVLPSPIKGLDAEPIAHKRKAPLLAVPHRESEHADEPLDRGPHTPFGDRLDDDFRVGMALEAVAERFELGPDLRGAIDLPVIGDDVTAAGGRHRLR